MHRQGQAGSMAEAKPMEGRAPEQPVPSPLPQAGIPAPGAPKAPLSDAAWHSPARSTLGPFSCRPGWVRSAGKKGQPRRKGQGCRAHSCPPCPRDSLNSAPTPTALRAQGDRAGPRMPGAPWRWGLLPGNADLHAEQDLGGGRWALSLGVPRPGSPPAGGTFPRHSLEGWSLLFRSLALTSIHVGCPHHLKPLPSPETG